MQMHHICVYHTYANTGDMDASPIFTEDPISGRSGSPHRAWRFFARYTICGKKINVKRYIMCVAAEGAGRSRAGRRKLAMLHFRKRRIREKSEQDGQGIGNCPTLKLPGYLSHMKLMGFFCDNNKIELQTNE